MKIVQRLKKILKRFSTPVFLRVSYLEPKKVVVICTRLDGYDNLFPLDWHIPLSAKPERYAISVWKTNSSLQYIEKSRVFSVNFMSSKFEDKIMTAGTLHGDEIDKFSVLGLKKESCRSIDCPYLLEASGHLECLVDQSIDAGDHLLFIASVTHSSLHNNHGDPELYHITNPRQAR